MPERKIELLLEESRVTRGNRGFVVRTYIRGRLSVLNFTMKYFESSHYYLDYVSCIFFVFSYTDKLHAKIGLSTNCSLITWFEEMIIFSGERNFFNRS